MRRKIANQIIECLGITPNVIRIRIAKMLLMGKATFWDHAEYNLGNISDISDLSHLSVGELYEIEDTIEKFLKKMVSRELRTRHHIFFYIWILPSQTQKSCIEMSVKVK